MSPSTGLKSPATRWQGASTTHRDGNPIPIEVTKVEANQKSWTSTDRKRDRYRMKKDELVCNLRPRRYRIIFYMTAFKVTKVFDKIPSGKNILHAGVQD